MGAEPPSRKKQIQAILPQTNFWIRPEKNFSWYFYKDLEIIVLC